jgi:radical SAM protein with 4Fe4S-binding SPASM domain
MTKITQPTSITIITTYRCMIEGDVREISHTPANITNEITVDEIKKLPTVGFINLIGEEPFIREDIVEIVRACYTKSPKVVIFTPGWFEERIILLAKEFPKIGIRITLDNYSINNEKIDITSKLSFDNALKILQRLKNMGIKDIGFEFTVSDTNSEEMLSIYKLSKSLNFDFATAVSDNSYFRQKDKNVINDIEKVCGNFEKLIEMQMNESHSKSWYQAFFNMGLINFIEGNRSMLPCECGSVNFVVDPYGEIYPCTNIIDKSLTKSMGNIRDYSQFNELWNSEKAQNVRKNVRKCPNNCWNEHTALPVMKKYSIYPQLWVLKNKLKNIQGKPLSLDKKYFNVGRNPKQGDIKKSFNIKVVVTGTRGIPNILGGVETHCEELFPRIVNQEYDVTIIRRKNYVTDALDEFKGVHLIDVNTPQKKSFEAIIHTFRAILVVKLKHQADIIHIHAIGPAILTPFARLLGMKVIFTHHGADYEREKWGKMAKLVLRLGERVGVKYANEVIVISEVINNHIVKKYGRKDAHLIFNGVNKPIKSKNTTYIDSLGIKKGNYVFAMGRFVPEKGFDLLIKVFAQLKLQDITLVIAGDTDHADEYSTKLKKLAQENNVVLTGFIKGEKLNELLSHAKLFVLPSYHEGLPIALLEAMSYNLDVLASDIPANTAVHLPKGCYFENKNELDLSINLLKKISNPALNVKYDLTPYNWDEIAKETALVYSDIL